MKIAITGHTKGIGKALTDKLSLEHQVIGFSKSTGYDITKKEDRRKIINLVQDCDVFINNAYDDFGQVSMLYELWRAWLTRNKTIISVGSDVTIPKLPLEKKDLLQYQIHKKSLKILHEDLQNLNTCVNIHYVTFGYVGTEQILSKDPPIPGPLIMPIEYAVNKILEVLV